mmetsp:Transcript_133989/g.260939  ORF Transcript_133989/g.260939 Transcript_133989/m.260939 type:complete len:247 (+) Transcript_133989:1011-1751(+)
MRLPGSMRDQAMSRSRPTSAHSASANCWRFSASSGSMSESRIGVTSPSGRMLAQTALTSFAKPRARHAAENSACDTRPTPRESRSCVHARSTEPRSWRKQAVKRVKGVVCATDAGFDILEMLLGLGDRPARLGLLSRGGSGPLHLCSCSSSHSHGPSLSSFAPASILSWTATCSMPEDVAAFCLTFVPFSFLHVRPAASHCNWSMPDTQPCATDDVSFVLAASALAPAQLPGAALQRSFFLDDHRS